MKSSPLTPFDYLKKILTARVYDVAIESPLEPARHLSERLGAPVLTGQTPEKEREVLFRQFREGQLRILIVSKVANFAIDLPDASVAIQVSGTFGSRQEEAQRLGRILRPKGDKNLPPPVAR